jgi:hypothetical protein
MPLALAFSHTHWVFMFTDVALWQLQDYETITSEINLPGLRDEIARFIMEQIINEEGDIHAGDSRSYIYIYVV